MFEYADPADMIGLVLMPIAALMLFLKEGRYNYLHKTNKKGERQSLPYYYLVLF